MYINMKIGMDIDKNIFMFIMYDYMYIYISYMIM
jgi:hypothetical protein